MGDWISDSEGEDVNEIRRNDEELINYLVDVRGTKKEKSEQRSKSKMKTVIKKIIREKHKRAKRIDSEKKRSNVINIKATVHRPMKSPSKLGSPRAIPVDPGEEPPCPNWVEQAAGGPTARIISGGWGEVFPVKSPTWSPV